ncbi:MAG: virulence factor [Gammaproteobacteria bacterium]|nr:virulence factor [Gammaproteobacteria bacterium]
MAKLITVYWRDIPAQVIVKQGRRTAKVQLSERFQEAIDRAAMRAGKGGTDAYLEEWRRETGEVAGDIDAAARERAEALEASIDDDMLAAMIRGKGRRPAADD